MILGRTNHLSDFSKNFSEHKYWRNLIHPPLVYLELRVIPYHTDKCVVQIVGELMKDDPHFWRDGRENHHVGLSVPPKLFPILFLGTGSSLQTHRKVASEVVLVPHGWVHDYVTQLWQEVKHLRREFSLRDEVDGLCELSREIPAT
jgi:hypothetical protein